MAVNIVGGENGGGLNFMTCAFKVLVSHTHGRQCPNEERSLCHFVLLSQ